MTYKRGKIFFFLFGFLLISILFNLFIIPVILGKSSIFSDNVPTEFGLETELHTIIHLHNPFVSNQFVYPFSINVALNDPSIALVAPFAILRFAFSPQQSLAIIFILEFFLNNICMYYLLRKLKISEYTSFFVSLLFSFTPFISQRVIGHYTYLSLYFFPMEYLILKSFIESRLNKQKLIYSLLFGLLMPFILLSNFYYFFVSLLAIAFSSLYFIFNSRGMLLLFLRKNWLYIVLSVCIMILLLLPWIYSVYLLIATEGIAKTQGLGGSLELSPDLVNVITPSEFNPFYQIIFARLATINSLFAKYNTLFLNSWEQIAYPGIILLVTYFIVLIAKIKKRIQLDLWKNISFHFILSIAFFILALGPFIKIFHRWSINLDGVAVVFPLPFLLFHYLPGLSILRASGRLVPILVFFMSIVTAYCLDYLFKKISSKKKILFAFFLFIIFLFDQYYSVPPAVYQNPPKTIYQYLKQKPDSDTVLEIPFMVRDGFSYLGFVHALQPIYGKTIDGKPTMGGYIARVPPKIFDYYRNLPFIGYILKTIDKGNYNPLLEKPKEIVLTPYPYSLDTIQSELSSFNISYVILKTDEVYSAYFNSLFSQVGFIQTKSDENYVLLERKK